MWNLVQDYFITQNNSTTQNSGTTLNTAEHKALVYNTEHETHAEGVHQHDHWGLDMRRSAGVAKWLYYIA